MTQTMTVNDRENLLSALKTFVNLTKPELGYESDITGNPEDNEYIISVATSKKLLDFELKCEDGQIECIPEDYLTWKSDESIETYWSKGFHKGIDSIFYNRYLQCTGDVDFEMIDDYIFMVMRWFNQKLKDGIVE